MPDQLERGNNGSLSMKTRSAAGLALSLSCGQLKHLIDTTAKPNAAIHVMPLATVIRATHVPGRLAQEALQPAESADYLSRPLCDF